MHVFQKFQLRSLIKQAFIVTDGQKTSIYTQFSSGALRFLVIKAKLNSRVWVTNSKVWSTEKKKEKKERQEERKQVCDCLHK